MNVGRLRERECEGGKVRRFCLMATAWGVSGLMVHAEDDPAGIVYWVIVTGKQIGRAHV